MNGPGRVYTVSEITAEIKAILEARYDLVWITGEISNFSAPVSGHLYFTLKDDSAQIRSVMFRGQNRRLTFRPEDGMAVTGMGRISLYEPRGAYQVIFEYLEPRGLGALQKAFEQLKAALSAEGLFDPAAKKPLPLLPRRIALLTSPTGAAVHDFLQIARRRFSGIAVDVMPVQVQGSDAAGEIAAALAGVDRWKRADVIVLARGGGSLEDLQAFNSETVARAIFAAQIPVVSAVGHETDFTIADFTADMRAPTPSAAAELVVPNKMELLTSCDRHRRRLTFAFTSIIKQSFDSLLHLNRRLVHPRRRIDEWKLRIDDLSGRTLRAMARAAAIHRERLAWQRRRLQHAGPDRRTSEYKVKLDEIKNKYQFLLHNYLFYKSSALQHHTARLAALNPMAVLERGYSITRTGRRGRIVTDPAAISAGQRLWITLARGELPVVAEKPREKQASGGGVDHGRQQTDI